MLKFVDIVNNYVKQENGSNVRKAIRLSSGYSVTYSDIEEKYSELVADLTESAAKDAAAQIQKDTGEKVTTDNTGNEAAANVEGNEEEEEKKDNSFEGNTRQMGVTLTMYSIERMQDPTDQLAAQDAQ